jgi:hypothetical protein
MRQITFALLFLVSAVAFGADLPAPAKAEVTQLLNTLGSSSCEFYRNGNWYKAAEAKAHLNSKYEYLLKKGLISSTEEFIRKGATESSMSGEPYQVRCPNEATQSSATWLGIKLRLMRAKSQP